MTRPPNGESNRTGGDVAARREAIAERLIAVADEIAAEIAAEDTESAETIPPSVLIGELLPGVMEDLAARAAAPHGPKAFSLLDAELTSTTFAGSDPHDVRYYATYAEAATDKRNLAPGAAIWGLDRATAQWQRLTAIPETQMIDVPTYYADPADHSVVIPPSRLRRVWAELAALHARSRKPRATKSMQLLAYQTVATYAALTGVTERAVEKALQDGRTDPLTAATSDAVSDFEYARRVQALLLTEPLDVPEDQLRTVCPECDEKPDIGYDGDAHFTAVTPTGQHVVVVGCEGYYVVNPNLVSIDSPNWHDAEGNLGVNP
jgi:hypothetical protein